MHGVATAGATSLMEQIGGHVLDVPSDSPAGQHFSSFSSVVKKAA